jgi:alpha-L-arabinofuranosidase
LVVVGLLTAQKPKDQACGGATRTKPGWPQAPAILEELYTLEDALVFCAALLTLINRCDRVKASSSLTSSAPWC